MRIIFVGDVDQLPSVGAGNVLRNIISSGIVPIVELYEIFRQTQDSDIIMNAHRINHGERPVINNKSSKDFFFEVKDEKEDIVKTIIELCTKRLPKKFNYNPIKDIQVLTPMQRGDIGVQKLNELLQKTLNSNQLYFFSAVV
jgi:exodeoxyribonuclease V alpha subunit